ncbi:MAG: hypothetical protein IKB04_04980 [Clostridia bacterium]|nr:hypothetical protein [Clostridia bacterium]
MNNTTLDAMNDALLSPADFITFMFERTDEDGVLYIPGWHYDNPGWEVNAPGSTDDGASYRCKMNWNLFKYEKVLAEFKAVYAALQHIAAAGDLFGASPEEAKAALADESVFAVWNTYVRTLDEGEFDTERVETIYDKQDTMEWVKAIAARLAAGETLESFEKEALAEYMDIAVTEEEVAYRFAYLEHQHKEAEKRLGDGLCAHDVYIRARRLCRLLALKAPALVVCNEARQFAAAFVLQRYGLSREVVDNTIRLRLEQMELMSEDELDELYRPQRSNRRKSLAPLFVFEILSRHSNSKTHLRQRDILKELEKYPYEISLERKALGRIIHNLVDTPQYAVFSDKSGVWIEQE